MAYLRSTIYQLLCTILFRVFHYSSRPSSFRSPRKTFGVVALEDKYAALVNRSTAATTTTKIFFPFVAVSKSPAVAVRPPYASSLITRAREQNVFYTSAATAATLPPFGADFRSGKSFGPRLGGRKRSSRGGGGVRGVD